MDREKAVRRLAELLDAPGNERPWTQIAQTFRRLSNDPAALIRQSPAVVAGHLLAAVREEQHEVVEVLVDLLSAASSAVTSNRVITALVLASSLCEKAQPLLWGLGAERVADAAADLAASRDEYRCLTGCEALECLLKLEIPGLNRALAQSVEKLCTVLSSRSAVVVRRLGTTACLVITRIISTGGSVPELPSRLKAVAQAVPKLPALDCGPGDDFAEVLCALVKALAERKPKAPRTRKLRNDDLPAARALARAHFSVLHAHVGRGRYEARPKVAASLKLLGAASVAAALFDDYLPQWNTVPETVDGYAHCFYLTPLVLAAEMLKKAKRTPYVEAEMRRLSAFACRAMETPGQNGQPPTWPLAVLDALGEKGFHRVFTRLFQPGRERLSQFDFDAEGTVARTLGRRNFPHALTYLGQVADYLLSGDDHLDFEADCVISELNNWGFAQISSMLLERAAAGKAATPELQAQMLSALSGMSRETGFVLKAGCAEQVFDCALSLRKSPAAAVRYAAAWVCLAGLRAMMAKDWRSCTPPNAGHHRGPDLALAIAEALGEQERKFVEGLRERLQTSTCDLTVPLCLPFLRVAMQQPENKGVRRMLASACDCGSGYWHAPYIGLNAGYMKDVQTAFLGEDVQLRKYASVIYPHVACTAPKEQQAALFGWMETQLVQSRPNSLAGQMVCTAAGVHPEAAREHPWIGEFVASRAVLQPEDRARLLRDLADGDAQLFASLLELVPASAGLTARVLADAGCRREELAVVLA